MCSSTRENMRGKMACRCLAIGSIRTHLHVLFAAGGNASRPFRCLPTRASRPSSPHEHGYSRIIGAEAADFRRARRRAKGPGQHGPAKLTDAREPRGRTTQKKGSLHDGIAAPKSAPERSRSSAVRTACTG